MLLGIDVPLPEYLFPEINARFEPDPDGHPRERLVVVREDAGPEERYFVSPYHGICEVTRHGQREESCNVCFAPFAAVRHGDGHYHLHGSACLRIDLSLWNCDEAVQCQRPFSVRADRIGRPGRWTHEVAGPRARFIRGTEAAAKIRRAVIGYLKANCAFLWSREIAGAIERAAADSAIREVIDATLRRRGESKA